MRGLQATRFPVSLLAMMKLHLLTDISDKIRDFYAGLPAPVRQLSDTLRLNRPVILMQVVWPCLWGFFSFQNGTVLSLPVLILMALLMAATTFIYLDLTDSSPDSNSEGYTRAPTSVLAGLLLASVLLLLVLAWQMNGATALLMVLWLMMLAAYPALQRLIWLPQMYIGLLLGAWPTLVGQAVAGGLTIHVALLFIAGFFWITGAETLRADIRSAREAGDTPPQTALLLGELRVPFMSGCFLATLLLLILCGLLMDVSAVYYIILMGAQLMFSQAFFSIKLHEYTAARRTYRRTMLAGLLIALAIAFGL